MCIFTLFQYREERFRQTSESTNSRVLWWSLGQTCILIVMGAWQMRHLKTFFEAKKLVWKMQNSYPSCGTPPCCTYNNPNLISKFWKIIGFAVTFFRVFFSLFFRQMDRQLWMNEDCVCDLSTMWKKFQFLVLILIII